jgi:hypothetical protein
MNLRLLSCILVILWPISSFLGAEPIWQKEITVNSNSGCAPSAVGIDTKGNKLVIFGATIRNGIEEGEFMLWEIDPNGNMLYQTQIGKTSPKSAIMPLFHRSGSISIREGAQIAVLGNFDVNTSSSLLTISRKGHEIDKLSMKNFSNSKIENRKRDKLILKMKPFSCNSQILVGRQGTDGLLIKLDDAGNEVWEKTFNTGKMGIFTDVIVKPDKIYVTGLTAPVRAPDKMGFSAETQNFLLLYDTNNKLIRENYFEGAYPTKLPQIIQLESGPILVAYDKSKNVTEVDLNVRAYNSDLELLWEKQLVKSGGSGPPGYFKIIAVSGDKFFVGAVFDGGELVIVECASDGTLVERWNFGKIVGPYGGLHLAELDKKIYAIFGTPSYGALQNVKIMALAFPIK